MESKKAELIEKESTMVVARRWGGGNEKMLIKGYKFSVIR